MARLRHRATEFRIPLAVAKRNCREKGLRTGFDPPQTSAPYLPIDHLEAAVYTHSIQIKDLRGCGLMRLPEGQQPAFRRLQQESDE
jgi:hypothetical protein